MNHHKPHFQNRVDTFRNNMTDWSYNPVPMHLHSQIATDSILTMLEALQASYQCGDPSGFSAELFAFDRMWPSEWVYSRLLRREKSDEAVAQFEQRFHKLGGVHIWCRLSHHADPDLDYPKQLSATQLNRAEELYQEFYTTVAVCPVYYSLDFNQELVRFHK